MRIKKQSDETVILTHSRFQSICLWILPATGATLLFVVLFETSYLFPTNYEDISQRICNNVRISDVDARQSRILLLGDSVDRYIADNFCETEGKDTCEWAPGIFQYMYGRATVLCNSSFGVMGQIHLFGSHASGPYLNNLTNSLLDPFVDTPKRICKALDLFSKAYGIPTMIVYQTMFWDVLMMVGQHETSNEVHAAIYQENVMARLDDISRCKDQSSLIALRTVPRTYVETALVDQLNNVVRNISRDAGFKLFDFDLLVWGPEGYSSSKENSLFRDNLHPREHICARFGLQIFNTDSLERFHIDSRRSPPEQVV